MSLALPGRPRHPAPAPRRRGPARDRRAPAPVRAACAEPDTAPRAARPGLTAFDCTALAGLRQARGWSKGQLARHAGVSIATITRLERGTDPSCHARTASRLAAALGRPPAALTRPAAAAPGQHQGQEESNDTSQRAAAAQPRSPPAPGNRGFLRRAVTFPACRHPPARRPWNRPARPGLAKVLPIFGSATPCPLPSTPTFHRHPTDT